MSSFPTYAGQNALQRYFKGISICKIVLRITNSFEVVTKLVIGWKGVQTKNKNSTRRCACHPSALSVDFAFILAKYDYQLRK